MCVQIETPPIQTSWAERLCSSHSFIYSNLYGHLASVFVQGLENATTLGDGQWKWWSQSTQNQTTRSMCWKERLMLKYFPAGASPVPVSFFHMHMQKRGHNRETSLCVIYCCSPAHYVVCLDLAVLLVVAAAVSELSQLLALVICFGALGISGNSPSCWP